MTASDVFAKLSIMALPLIFGITLHEAAHGWVANKLGDRTALMLGRVTLNPLKHIDLFGTLILPVVMLILTHFTFMFGWAKPVPVTWSNLKKPRRDMAIVALAGPGANLLMALIWASIAKLALLFHAGDSMITTLIAFFVLAGSYGIMLNCVLLVLNLIPIPPLDGSRVISAILPPRLSYRYGLIERYGIWIILALVFLLGRVVLFPPVIALIRLISGWFGLPLNV